MWKTLCAPISLLALVFLAACDAEKPKVKNQAASEPMAAAPQPPAPPPAPTHPQSAEIEKLTGAHTRVVWAQYQKPKSAEPYSNASSHFLMGLDSKDGLGAHPILAVNGNYSRPLITSDGEAILFSDKRLSRDDKNNKVYNPIIQLTDWKGTAPKTLAEGYAVDTWRDPASGTEWVYAVRDFVSSTRIAIEAKKMVRFQLNDPSKEELVWDQTAVSPDNIQLSRDGSRASGQFPWPNVGQFLLGQNKDFKKLITGCWPSLSPDNSQISWGLDGEHREATFFADDGAKTWTVKLNSHPELAKGEIYHPRWTNHPRFITLTGPYLGEMVAGQGSVIGKGGLTADVYIGKFSEKLDAFEGWVCVDKNALGDAYPDVWIAGGNEAVLAEFPQKDGQAAVAPTAPQQNAGLVFRWEDRNQNNTVKLASGAQLDCSMETRGAARYGRRLDLLLDAGAFQPKADALAAISSHLSADHPAALSFLMALDDVKNPGQGVIAQLPGLVIKIEAGQWMAISANSQATLPIGAASPVRVIVNKSSAGAVNLVLRSSADTQRAAGVPVAGAVPGETQFGGGGVSGGMRDIAIHDRELSDAEIMAATVNGTADQTAPPARIRLRGKLAESSPMPTEEGINPYTSAMVACIYDVVSVSEGTYTGKQILVKHWGMLTRQMAAGFPRSVGQEYDLVVEPLDAHPELKGDRSMELDVFDLETYYDVSTPSVVASP